MIARVASLIEDNLLEYLQAVFSAVATPLGTLLNSVAIVALLLLALNHVLQLKQMQYSAYIEWFIRYLLVCAFALVWGNFSPIYTLITEVPGDYSALLIKAAMAATPGGPVADEGLNQYRAMDMFTGQIFAMANYLFGETSIWSVADSIKNIGLGILLVIVGALWTIVSLIIVMIAQIGLMMALSLAPLAIAMLMLEQTRQYFESWSRFILSFLVIPLFLSALTAMLLFVAMKIRQDIGEDSHNTWLYLFFACMMVGATVMLWRLPEMGMAIAGSAVGAAGTAIARGTASAIARSPKTANDARRFTHDAIREAAHARKGGAGVFGSVMVGINAMRQSSHMRQQRRDATLGARRERTPGKSWRTMEAGNGAAPNAPANDHSGAHSPDDGSPAPSGNQAPNTPTRR